MNSKIELNKISVDCMLIDIQNSLRKNKNMPHDVLLLYNSILCMVMSSNDDFIKKKFSQIHDMLKERGIYSNV